MILINAYTAKAMINLNTDAHPVSPLDSELIYIPININTKIISNVFILLTQKDDTINLIKLK